MENSLEVICVINITVTGFFENQEVKWQYPSFFKKSYDGFVIYDFLFKLQKKHKTLKTNNLQYKNKQLLMYVK